MWKSFFIPHDEHSPNSLALAPCLAFTPLCCDTVIMPCLNQMKLLHYWLCHTTYLFCWKAMPLTEINKYHIVPSMPCQLTII